MARAIDADKLKKELAPYEENDFSQQIDVILKIVDMQPTLTPPNEPLSVLVKDEPDREYIDYICPRCKSIISQRRRGQSMSMVYQCKYHDNCGQRVDWSNPQPYRHPPEGEEDAK